MAFFLHKAKSAIFALLHFSIIEVLEKWRYIPVSHDRIVTKVHPWIFVKSPLEK